MLIIDFSGLLLQSQQAVSLRTQVTTEQLSTGIPTMYEAEHQTDRNAREIGLLVGEAYSLRDSAELESAAEIC